MVRTVTLFMILLFSAATLSAQKGALAGVWDVQGQSPKGLSYEGKLDIKAVNAPLYRLTWDIQYEDEEQNKTYPGTAIFNEKESKMYAAYGINTLRYGLISYPLTEEGGLQGSATWTSHNGGGAELLGGTLDGDIEGTYEVVGRRSLGDVDQGVSETYSGTLIIEKVRDYYRLKWYLGDGMPYSGFAYKTDTALIGAWGIEGAYGMEIYTIGSGLKRAKGIWVSPDYDMLEGSEMLRKR